MLTIANSVVRGNSSHTIGVEFGSKVISIGTRTIKLQIWDTAGQERFRSVTRSYYRGAAGALLVFDITDRQSFKSLPTWLSDARSLASSSIVLVLVGNKSDLAEQRQVTALEASQFAQENDLVYLECSTKSGDGVAEVFLKCARSIIMKVESGVIDPERSDSGIQYGTIRNLEASGYDTSRNSATARGLNSYCCK